MRYKILFVAGYFLVSLQLASQTITFGESTTFQLGEQTSFFAGGNTTFNGTVSKTGTIISYSDLDLKANDTIAGLSFVGRGDQTLLSDDTLYVSNVELSKQGRLVIATIQVFVDGQLNVTSGIIEAAELDDLLVTGTSNADGDGYVEGQLIGLTLGRPVTFPMGLNGFKNYVTFSDTQDGVTILVNCREPEANSLLPDEDMVGIADEVEWVARTLADKDGNNVTTSATVSVDFSGLDLVNFSNGQAINAELYQPAIVMIQKEDTLHQALVSTEATPENGNSTSTTGRVVSSTTITLDTTETRLSVAWLPIVDGPEFFVPTAFSPSAFLEENQRFRPFFAGGEVSSVSIQVYNAFNAEVYRFAASGASLDLEQIGWDGTLNSGQGAESGVYYYNIQVIADGEVYTKAGSVLLTY